MDEGTCNYCDVNLKRENAGLRAQVLNLMGKLEVRENFVPRVIVDLASCRKLEVTADDNGCYAKIKMSHWDAGS